MSSTWERDPVWFHGDVAATNLLVRDGRLAGVLDFGTSGIGDPACDVVIAYTFLTGEARDRFQAEYDVDGATWARGRGWALWKALITLAGQLEEGSPEAAGTRLQLDRILAGWLPEAPVAVVARELAGAVELGGDREHEDAVVVGRRDDAAGVSAEVGPSQRCQPSAA